MIDFELTEEQKQFKTLIKEFSEREIDFKQLQQLADQASKARKVKELRAIYPKELMKKFHAVGLRQLCVPTEYGGGGFGRCGSLTLAIVSEELGYYMGIGSRLLTVPNMTLCDMSSDEVTREEKDWFS